MSDSDDNDLTRARRLARIFLDVSKSEEDEHWELETLRTFARKVTYEHIPCMELGLNPVDLFMSTRWNGADLYRVTIPKNQIMMSLVGDHTTVVKDITAYFFQGIFVEDQEEFREQHILGWRVLIETYLKMVWLYEESYHVGKPFKYPIGAHYHPGCKKVVAHPGSVRMRVYGLFGPDKQEYLYYNTNGVMHGFMDNAVKVDAYDYHNPPNIRMEVVPDFGTLIPHIHFHVQDIEPNVQRIHTRLRDRFIVKKERVRSNVSLNLPGWFFSPDGRYHVEWKVPNPNKAMTARAAIVLGCEDVTYEDDFVKIWSE